MYRGWVSVWRKVVDDVVFKEPEIFKVFIWCLLKATHDDYVAVVDRYKVKLKPGQFVSGRMKAAQELKMPPDTVKNYINFLTGRDRYSHRYGNRELDIKCTPNYSVITIRNWKKYQGLGQPWDTYNNIPPRGGNEKKKPSVAFRQIFRDLTEDKQIQKEWEEKQK